MFDDDLSGVLARTWEFTSSDGFLNTYLLANVFGDGVPRITSFLNVAIEKPATLVLKNVNQSYDGTYKFNLVAPVSGRSTVVVFIASEYFYVV